MRGVKALFVGLVPGSTNAGLLTLSTFINTVGTGLYMSVGAIYLVRSAGLTPTEVGAGLTIGSLVGVGVGPLIGDMADRRGPREVLIGALMVQAFACVGLLVVDDVALLAVSAALSAVGTAGSRNARGALIARITDQGSGPRLRTYLRAITNAGLALGTIGAAVVLQLDTRAAYAVMILIDTASFVVAGAVIARIPHVRPTRAHRRDRSTGSTGPRWIVLRDRRYLLVAALTSIATIQYFVIIYALPLWITLRTSAPRAMAAGLFFFAAVVVTVIQVPATRSITDSRSAARLLAISGPVFAIAWVLIALASHMSIAVAIALLVAGVLVHSLAEVLQAGAAFELSFSLADPQAHGQYQGIFGLGHDLVEAVAPTAVIALCVTWGRPGWFVLALVVIAASAGAAAASGRGEPLIASPTGEPGESRQTQATG